MIRIVRLLVPSLLALTIVTLPLAVAASAATPAQVCQAGKNNVTGKYHYCRQKAEAKYSTTSNSAARTAALQKCLDKYNAAWSAVEKKAGGACPNTGDATQYQNDVDTDTTNIATGLAGGTLHDYSAEAATCQDGLSTCNADLIACQSTMQQLPATGQMTCWDTGGAVVPCAGTGQDGQIEAGRVLAYVDNGDGTITDTNTGLMWEKKSDDGTIHDMKTTYSWDNSFAVHIAGLNSASFAGHADWRMPDVKELQSIINYENVFPAVSPEFNNGCALNCTVLTCSCTLAVVPGPIYWSSTTYTNAPYAAFSVRFSDGYVNALNKATGNVVRAVRGGS
jgi:hypothetical protein